MKLNILLWGGWLAGLFLAACSSASEELPAPQESAVPQLATRAATGEECTYIGIRTDGTKAFGHNARYDGEKWVWSVPGTTIDWTDVPHFAIASPVWNPSSVTGGVATLTQAELSGYATTGLLLGAYSSDSQTDLYVHQQLARLDIVWPEGYAMNPQLTLRLAGSANVQLNGTQTAENVSLLTVSGSSTDYELTLSETQQSARTLHLPIFPQTFEAGSVLFSYTTGSEAAGTIQHHVFRIPEGKDYAIGINQNLQVKLESQAADEETIPPTITVGGISAGNWLSGNEDDTLTTE